MAEKNSTCTVEGCGAPHVAHGYCGKHYKRYRRRGCADDVVVACTVCGAEFRSERATQYCSQKCKTSAWRKRNPEVLASYRAREVPSPKFTTVTLLTCKCCGKSWWSRNKRSHACSEVCRLELDRRRAVAYEMAKQGPPKVRKCSICGNEFTKEYGRFGARSFCSEFCEHKAARACRSALKSKRRAIERGCDAELFDPLEILERDGWRCQICAKPTPKSKRGTYDHDAPEVDHIIPLAKGGSHTRANVQCACRACNGAKSDKELGQMLLFG